MTPKTGNAALIIWVLVSGLVLAQRPVATASSAGPFRLNGLRTPSGVPTWPVFPGMTIGALEDPVLVTYRDRRQVVIPSNTQVVVRTQGVLEPLGINSPVEIEFKAVRIRAGLPASGIRQRSIGRIPID